MSGGGTSLLKSNDDRRSRTKPKVSFSMDSLSDFLDIKEEFPKALLDDNWVNNMDSNVDLWNTDPSDLNLDLDGIKVEDSATGGITNEGDQLLNFDDLGDLTEILNSPLFAEDNGSSSAGSSSGSVSYPDLDFFESSEIKTDLMLSSTLIDDAPFNSAQMRNRRRRDVSVTLSECAEGFLALKDMELLDNNSVGNHPTFGVSPTLGNTFQFVDTPMATSESDTETGASTDDDEEIDVVSEDVGSSRTRVHQPKLRTANASNANKDIKAGRSLLKARHQKPQQPKQTQTTQPNKHHLAIIDHVNGDHSYFLARPKPAEAEVFNDQADKDGVLTPSESGEEDVSDRLRAMGYDTLTTPAEVDKRKIVAAVQALAQKQGMIRGRQTESKANDVKFRFKMRFKSNSPQRSQTPDTRSLLIQPRQGNNHFHPYPLPKDRLRRKSASRNSHCPPPSSAAVTTPAATLLSTPLLAGGSVTTPTARAVKIQDSRAAASTPTVRNKSVLSSRVKSPEEKCREIRDLHNRMERQRRVDLKNNYDQLKDCVPSLADVDKASKLNILNKAADYCRLLVSSEAKLRKDIDKETQRNMLLRKKLSALMTQLDHGTRLSSGRLSVIKRFE